MLTFLKSNERSALYVRKNKAIRQAKVKPFCLEDTLNAFNERTGAFGKFPITPQLPGRCVTDILENRHQLLLCIPSPWLSPWKVLDAEEMFWKKMNVLDTNHSRSSTKLVYFLTQNMYAKCK